MATPERIEEAREQEREKGCACACELVLDPNRIRAVGGDPDNEKTIVFHHTWECPATRIHWARYN